MCAITRQPSPSRLFSQALTSNCGDSGDSFYKNFLPVTAVICQMTCVTTHIHL